MKKIMPFVLSLFLIVTACNENQPAASSTISDATNSKSFSNKSIFDGASRMTFVDPENLYSFDYPDKASLATNCDPVELHTVTDGETTTLEPVNDPNAEYTACNGRNQELKFTVYKASSSAEVEAIFSTWFQNTTCGKELTMETFPDDSDEVFQVFPKEPESTDDPFACMSNARIRWNKTKGVLLISPGKSNAPYLFYGRKNDYGDYEVEKTLRFL